MSTNLRVEAWKAIDPERWEGLVNRADHERLFTVLKENYPECANDREDDLTDLGWDIWSRVINERRENKKNV